MRRLAASIKGWARRTGRLVFSLTVAVAVNAALFLTVAALNRNAPAQPQNEAQRPVRYSFSEPQPQPEPEQSPQTEQQDQSTPKPLDVAVQPPEPAPVSPKPMPLALELPAQTLSPVEVASPQQQREPVASESTGQQANQQQAQQKSERQTKQQGVSQRPRLIHKPRLRYMAHQFDSRRDGVVIVRFDIDRQGQVADAELVRVEQGPEGLGPALMKVIDRFRFSPPKRDGEAVAYTQTMRIQIKLQ
jgi:protein TonB